MTAMPTLTDTAAYLVIRTDWTNGLPAVKTVVARIEGATNYADALELVYQVRAGATRTQYGIIENVYNVGDSQATLDELMTLFRDREAARETSGR
jgi:hypothetical protein